MNLKNILPDFKNTVDFFIDGGDAKLGIASTILKVENGNIHMLRAGSITPSQIKEVTGLEVI